MTRRRILLIQRASLQRDALAGLLTSEGHEVRVTDGPEATEAVAGFGGDLIVCDLEALEDSPAAELAERIEAARSRLVLVRGATQTLPEVEAVAVLARPINLEELRRVIREG